MCRPVYFLCLYCGARRFFLWEECRHFWERYHQIVLEQDEWEDRPRVSRSADEPPDCGGGIQQFQDREAPLGRCPRLGDCPSLHPYLSTWMREPTRTLAGTRGGDVPMTERQIDDFFRRRGQWNSAIDNARMFRWPAPRVAPEEVTQDTRWSLRRQDGATAPNRTVDADDERGEERGQGETEEQEAQGQPGMQSAEERGQGETEEQEAQGQPGMQSAEDMADDSEDGVPPQSLLSETTAPMLHLSSYRRPTAGAESLSLSQSNLGVESDSDGDMSHSDSS